MDLLVISVTVLIVGMYAYFNPKSKLSFQLIKLGYLMEYNALGAIEVLINIKNYFFNRSRDRLVLSKKTGKIAIVTGGSRGIGVKIVQMLLECDMEVIIACRKPQAGQDVIKKIRESVKTGKAKVFQLDNACLESVRQFVERIKRDYSKIDVLINNAGIMFGPYQETIDGFEKQWAVNYLSHFLLTSLLLPLLEAGGSITENSRIVNVSSCAHYLGTINLTDPSYKDGYLPTVSYGQSKLAQAIFTNMLQKELKERMMNINVYTVHPGVVNTDLFNHSFVGKFRFIFKYFLKTPLQGAKPVVYAAIEESLEDQGGIYMSNCEKTFTSSLVSDISLGKKLFQLSIKQAELKDFFEYSSN